MTYQSDANSHKKVFNWWQLLLLTVLMLGLLFLLFPKQLFMKKLLNNKHPSDVSVSYLKEMLDKNPSDFEVLCALAREEIILGKFKDARKLILPYLTYDPQSEFQWAIYMLNFQLSRSETFALKPTNPKRKVQESQLKYILKTLSKSPFLTPDEQADLGDYALAMNLSLEANQFYTMAIDNNVVRPASFYAKAGLVALYIKDYQSSAQRYLIAMNKARKKSEKQKYYIKAVTSLLSSGNSASAFDFAMKNLDGMDNDATIKLFLAKVALSAGNQQKAKQYMDQLLYLQLQDVKND